MSQPYSVEVTDFDAVQRIKDHVKLGHYFVYVDDAKALGEEQRGGGRLARLLVKKKARGGRQVLPLVDDPVELAGVMINPLPREIDPVGCVVTDRDLYRAEQDTVSLLVAIAMPDPPEGLQLSVECNGQPFTTLDPECGSEGMTIETLSMLLPGSYTAQLSLGERKLGTPAAFTVAEYTLAPLSGRLASHRLDRDTDQLSFELAVESYQVPFDGKLHVILVDRDQEVQRITLKPEAPGRFAGRLKMRGEGPFRLRLVSADDAERVAEVVIPGSRAREREASVISELGQEVLFSMMPEAEALPLRGGFLSEGDFLATPLTVEQVVSEKWTLQVKTDLEALSLVILDLTSGSLSVQKVGDVKAGKEVQVKASGGMSTVFAGCFVDDSPFEGYTTFVTPGRLELSVETPETIRPRQDLVVKLSCEDRSAGSDPVPVLLCVRDERLTATDPPDKGLGASAKRSIDAATESMAEAGIEALEQRLPLPEPPVYFGAPAVIDYLDEPPDMMLPSGSAVDGPVEVVRSMSMSMEDVDYERSDEVVTLQSVSASTRRRDMGDALFRLSEQSPFRAQGRKLEQADLAPEPARTEFPEVLFYNIVPIPAGATEEVVIPMGDSLATFTVEAFALQGGDWTLTREAVVVDQPVRLDLELPPAVHDKDKVVGRLRVVTSSGKALVSLTRDGEEVLLRDTAGQPVDLAAGPVSTPAQLELEVLPGTYRASVEDVSSRERDSAEVVVTEPGRFKSYARQLGLLRKGDELTLDSAEALTLRVLPGVSESFDALLTATAGYAHLCCEQTAAKILAAVFMYLTVKKRGKRRKAEQIILAGIAREKKMIRPGQGFAMYPRETYVSDHYSRLAVRYLWHLSQLAELPDISSSLRQAARQGLELADTAAEAHGMGRAPKKIRTMEEAYAGATDGGDRQAILGFIDEAVDFAGAAPRPKRSTHRVAGRSLLAYAGAALFALGELDRGVRVANCVTRQFNDQGALYSTVDSVGAIALMIQLRVSGVVSGEGRVRVNGEEMTTVEAAKLADQVESVEVLDGVAAVEVTRVHEEDWDAFSAAFPLKVGFRDKRNKRVKRFKMGDRADLVVTLPDGYKAGDLAHVALPAGMAWIKGGGKVKRFTLDFEGQDELRVPLIVTSKIEGKQHFAVCVRNMFEEERATSPGLLAVEGPSRWWG